LTPENGIGFFSQPGQQRSTFSDPSCGLKSGGTYRNVVMLRLWVVASKSGCSASDEAMTDLPELAGLHFKRRVPLSERFELRRDVHRNSSNTSDSCARPPLTLLKAR
jgi:hypothetical protein